MKSKFTKRTVKKRKLCINEILTVFITRSPFACFSPQSSLRFEGRKNVLYLCRNSIRKTLTKTSQVSLINVHNVLAFVSLGKEGLTG